MNVLGTSCLIAFCLVSMIKVTPVAMLSSSLVLSLVLIANLVSAYETFHPNCTFPHKTVNLVTSPEIRGTFNILWSCLFTLLICTWTIQHLNVPAQKPRETKSCWEGLKDLLRRKGSRNLRVALGWSLRRVWRRVKWMLIT